MSEVQKAWLGALIEGEGCCGFRKRKKERYMVGVVSVTNTDPELISACLRFTGVGVVTLGKPHSSRAFLSKRELKPVWIWTVWRRSDVEELSRVLSPYCMKIRKVSHALYKKED